MKTPPKLRGDTSNKQGDEIHKWANQRKTILSSFLMEVAPNVMGNMIFVQTVKTDVYGATPHVAPTNL